MEKKVPINWYLTTYYVTIYGFYSDNLLTFMPLFCVVISSYIGVEV